MDPATMASMAEMAAQKGSNFLSNIFTDSSKPYQDAMNQYGQYAQQGANALSPYNQAGQGEIGNYQKWLQSQQNPTQFINNEMNQYQESPNAKYMQQQAIRAAQNAGSAEGLVGSSPYTQQVEQNAENISQQDMNNWLQNVLGINTQYGQGMNNLINGGENSANALANLYAHQGDTMANLQYGKDTAHNQSISDMISDIF